MTTQVGEINRQTYIGGSDAAAILGLSKWDTPLTTYEKKLGFKEEITAEKAKFFKRRKRQEPVVAEILAEEYGIDITILSTDDEQNRYKDAEFPFIAAEIDFEWRMNDAARALLPAFAHIPNGTLMNGEIKTVHPFSAGEWGEQGTEDIPVYYAAQVMHGLGVTPDRPGTLVAAMFGVDDVVCYPIVRDDETIAGMRKAQVDFWNNHVLAGVPPEPSNMDDIKRLFAKAKGVPVDVSDEIRNAMLQLEQVKQAIRSHELTKEELEFQIALAVVRKWGFTDPAEATDNAEIRYNGAVIATWKSQRGASLDQKRLKEDHPALVAEYTKETRFRVLRTKKEK